MNLEKILKNASLNAIDKITKQHRIFLLQIKMVIQNRINKSNKTLPFNINVSHTHFFSKANDFVGGGYNHSRQTTWHKLHNKILGASVLLKIGA